MTTQYQPNIPTGLVNLDVDYQNLQNNFSQLDTSFGVNHIKYSVAPNNGKHTFVEMPISAAIPTPLAASEGTLYTKTISGVTELFYTPDNSANEYQITRTITANFGAFSTNTTALPSGNGVGGWTFLPGGLLLQYGSFNPNTSITVRFPIAFTSTPFIVELTGSADNNSTFRAGVSTGTLTNIQFVFEGSVSSHWTPIYFMAIGK